MFFPKFPIDINFQSCVGNQLDEAGDGRAEQGGGVSANDKRGESKLAVSESYTHYFGVNVKPGNESERKRKTPLPWRLVSVEYEIGSISERRRRQQRHHVMRVYEYLSPAPIIVAARRTVAVLVR